jgi:hypothetical protein
VAGFPRPELPTRQRVADHEVADSHEQHRAAGRDEGKDDPHGHRRRAVDERLGEEVDERDDERDERQVVERPEM